MSADAELAKANIAMLATEAAIACAEGLFSTFRVRASSEGLRRAPDAERADHVNVSM